MEIIDNLDSLEIGDWIRIAQTSWHSRKNYVGIVTKSNKSHLYITIQFYMGEGPLELFPKSKCIDGGIIEIAKTPRIIKKRKLKHKQKSYNKEFVIHRLNNKQIERIKNQNILMELGI